MQRRSFIGGAIAASLLRAPSLAQADPLPSWNDGAAKKAILDFVARVTTHGGADFVPVPERIATFDNDGTLWSEQPIYFQFAFAIDRVKAHGAAASGMEGPGAVQVGAGRRSDGARRQRREGPARDHRRHARRHDDRGVPRRSSATGSPRRGIRVSTGPTPSCVYQPMLELLAYLRANEFKTFIVSGGGVEFMRPWTEKVYGIPPEQVVGSVRRREVRAAATASRCCSRSPRSSSSTTGRASRSASTASSAAGRSSPSATPTAISRCCEWTAAGDRARASGPDRPSHRRRARVRLRPPLAVGRLDKALDEARKRKAGPSST